MRWPLKNQILLPLLGLMLLTIILVSCTSAFLADQREKQRIESHLGNVMTTLEGSRFPLTQNVLNQMKGLSGADFVVRNQNGGIVTSTCEPQAINSVSAQLVEQQMSEISLGNRIRVGQENFFHVSIPVGEGTSQRRIVDILFPEKQYIDAWQQAVMPPLVIGLIAFGLSVIASIILATRLTRPIERLRSRVERIAEGDFHSSTDSKHIASTRDDEIRDLSTAVNHMADMLSKYEGQVRRHEQLRTLGQLGGGIAHQLRNSVTGCRLAMEIHLRECRSSDFDSLQVALRQLELIEEYLKRFLALGQSQKDDYTDVDLNQLADDALQMIQPSADHAKVIIESVLCGDRAVKVHGSANALSQMLMNLLLNAIDATTHFMSENSQAPRGPIRLEVKLDQAASTVVIEVSDGGAGPDADVQDQIFEPLVTEKPSGVGLGLSVVKNVAEQHDGTVSWHRENDRTCFVVQLPYRKN